MISKLFQRKFCLAEISISSSFLISGKFFGLFSFKIFCSLEISICLLQIQIISAKRIIDSNFICQKASQVAL